MMMIKCRGDLLGHIRGHLSALPRSWRGCDSTSFRFTYSTVDFSTHCREQNLILFTSAEWNHHVSSSAISPMTETNFDMN